MHRVRGNTGRAPGPVWEQDKKALREDSNYLVS